jgi:hypothetical protein
VVVARLPVPALACKTGSEGIRAPFRQLQVVVRGVATDTAFGTVSNLVVALARLAVIGIGGALVVQGQLTIGTLIAFRGDVGGLFGPVQGLSGTYQSLQKARVSLEQIFGILDMQERLGDRPGAIDLPLMRFYDPESGRVLFDGDDLRDLKQGRFAGTSASCCRPLCCLTNRACQYRVRTSQCQPAGGGGGGTSGARPRLFKRLARWLCNPGGRARRPAVSR